MRKESSNILGFLFSLLILLFIRDIQASKLQQNPCSSSCGDIKNIKHPFRLKGDPARCGDRDFELSCQSNKTILEFNSGKYYVKRISYDQHLITVVDVNLADGSCGLLSNYPSLPYYRQRGIDYPPNFERARVVARCSGNISEYTWRRIPCSNKNKSDVFVTFDSMITSDFSKSCSFISFVPINHAPAKLHSYESINKLLQSGFDLMWSVECRDCEKKGGHHCSVDLDGEQYYSFTCSTTTMGSILLVIGNVIEIFLLRIVTYLFHVSSSLVELLFTLSGMPYMPLNNFPHLSYFPVITRFVFLMVFVVLIICKYKKTKKTVDNVEEFLYNQQAWMLKRYSYIEIIAITNHFRNKLGQGGFGTVYKAQLFNGSLVAVKVLENSKFSGEEFINEVSTLGRIHHSNVVRLVGFCSEGSKRALIYEYMSNGSLDRYIFSKRSSSQSFSWEKLKEIALGTARGIDYLHNGCDVCILHFDIKPDNILLDHNFNPKVADFGLAKLHPRENNFISVKTRRGTIGYIAPELISRNFGVISSKSDVYSFGMLLLEMVGGRRNSFAEATHSSKEYFPSWVYDQIIEGRDLELQNASSFEDVIGRKLCIIGLWCIQVKAIDRPSITKVVEMLEGSIDDLQMPPKPFFSPST